MKAYQCNESISNQILGKCEYRQFTELIIVDTDARLASMIYGEEITKLNLFNFTTSKDL